MATRGGMLTLLAFVISSAEARLDLAPAPPPPSAQVDCPSMLDDVLQRRRSSSRQRYKGDLVNLKVTSRAENQEWVASKTSRAEYTYFTADVMLRDLNTKFKDKEFATAIVHDLHRTMDHDVSWISGLLRQSDFKSFRLAVPGRLGDERRDAIMAKLRGAIDVVLDQLRQRNLIRRDDRLEDLVYLAAGRTADWADLLAKLSRKGQAATEADAEHARRLVVQNLDWFARYFSGTSLFDATTGVPQRKVFDLVKKFKSPLELVVNLNRRFPDAHVTPSDVVHLRNLLESVSLFTSGLHVIERVVVSLANAGEGGASLDFRGMNAANLHVTAAALRRAADVDEVLELARAGEEAVTAEFRSKIRALQRLGDFVCSGDDCIYRGFLTAREKTELLRRINADPLLRDVRVAFIPPGIVARDERHILATHGEAIENYLRLILESQLPAALLDGATFAIDMRTTKLNDGAVALMVASPVALDRRALARAFKDAVRMQNEAIGSESARPATYRAL